MVYLGKTIVVKVTEETHKDLQTIQEIIVEYGAKSLPEEFEVVLKSLKSKSTTYKTIIAISVKLLRRIAEESKEKLDSRLREG